MTGPGEVRSALSGLAQPSFGVPAQMCSDGFGEPDRPQPGYQKS
jgi:hypothetical protein